ncbi:MAG: UDP-glucose/GDP-mannose dehydrogenase family protein [Acidobacteriaceae bacterium]|nr:UDP-glucose/GDP-mannose dehydrogenase family protein [Acidobacteriaceae bacterium]MBV9295534.1 UDP-glucose/GDP-mannose dehydrogenase family protein [Acidobacteriaceae bacterium]MBV9763849.1 UDP-glucose/GDP-mannose dehydrogenase family protein [Acidobacteriaceae bacterium]
MEPEKSTVHVAVLGLGYVGCVSAACLANLGHRVTGIDRDESKVHNISNGVAPFFEPGLEPILHESVSSGRLTASTSIGAIENADIALVCVGTPSEKNGNLGLDQLRRVISEIASTLPSRTKPLIVAIRSTVFPGTCEEHVIPAFAGNPLISVACNPEFLREGVAVKDFREPSLVVVGGTNDQAVGQVAALYSALGVPPCLVSLRTAEMIKYACNAFHAVKIAFANEIGALSARLDVDPGEVMTTLCEDTKLNIASTYLRPGFAFGGSCLPKDLRALTYRAKRLDLQLPLLESALPSNQHHLQRAIEAILDLPSRRLGVIGLAFKENTDDLRESPVVTLLEQLIGKGRQVRVYDPHIQLEAIYGSNRNFILQQIPHIGRLLDTSLQQTLDWADHIVIAQKLSPNHRAQIAQSGLPVTDVVSPSLAYASAPLTSSAR